MKKKIAEGRTKRVFQGDNDNELVFEFRDDYSDSPDEKKMAIKQRGVINNQVSAHLFRLLGSYNFGTHFIKETSDRTCLVKKLTMIPLVVVVRNVAAGSLVKRYGIEEGKELDCPIIEYYLKSGEPNAPLINNDHIVSFGHASADDLREIHRLALKMNIILKDFFRRRYLKLIDFRVEFGHQDEKIVLGDDLALDSFRFLDLESNEKLDRGVFNKSANEAGEALVTLKKRILLEK